MDALSKIDPSELHKYPLSVRIAYIGLAELGIFHWLVIDIAYWIVSNTYDYFYIAIALAVYPTLELVKGKSSLTYWTWTKKRTKLQWIIAGEALDGKRVWLAHPIVFTLAAMAIMGLVPLDRMLDI
ncbi:MAG: hypothetical protein JJT76_18435 [Clostridiaceae bacterium]|nr:hypothetical protein [Clostridiaceae bacterium]